MFKISDRHGRFAATSHRGYCVPGALLVQSVTIADKTRMCVKCAVNNRAFYSAGDGSCWKFMSATDWVVDWGMVMRCK